MIPVDCHCFTERTLFKKVTTVFFNRLFRGLDGVYERGEKNKRAQQSEKMSELAVIVAPHLPQLSIRGSLRLCYSDARHRDILGRHNGSRETPLSDEKNASKKYRSPVTSKRDSCTTVIIQRQWTLCMVAYSRIRTVRWGCPQHNAESHPLSPDLGPRRSRTLSTSPAVIVP